MNYSKNCTAMTIGEIITKHFDEFSGMVRNPDVVIENGNTSEDLFQSAMVTAIKKFKGEVDETEGLDKVETSRLVYEYVKKTLLTEFFFSYKRKKRDILLFPDENFDAVPGL